MIFICLWVIVRCFVSHIWCLFYTFPSVNMPRFEREFSLSDFLDEAVNGLERKARMLYSFNYLPIFHFHDAENYLSHHLSKEITF